MFKDKGHDSLNMLEKVGEWADMYQKYRNEEITEKEYLDWKSQFSVVERGLSMAIYRKYCHLIVMEYRKSQESP